MNELSKNTCSHKLLLQSDASFPSQAIFDKCREHKIDKLLYYDINVKQLTVFITGKIKSARHSCGTKKKGKKKRTAANRLLNGTCCCNNLNQH